MTAAWLLKSSTLWRLLVISGLASACILLLSPDGVPSLRKRQTEMAEQLVQLQKMRRSNLELSQEVRRLAAGTRNCMKPSPASRASPAPGKPSTPSANPEPIARGHPAPSGGPGAVRSPAPLPVHRPSPGPPRARFRPVWGRSRRPHRPWNGMR